MKEGEKNEGLHFNDFYLWLHARNNNVYFRGSLGLYRAFIFPFFFPFFIFIV
ncbi:MAG: hypothetical protein IJQ29_05390 [Synergistaceae bacterium]|nr:hypothetical protein [Synergistaceae bacterium]